METITWIDPLGVSTALHTVAPHQQARFVAWDLANRFSPPIRFEEDAIPEQDGARFRAVHHEPTEFPLPVWVQGSSASDLRTKIRALATSMNPKRGDGYIRVTSPVGDQRQIKCRVAEFDVTEKIGDTTGVSAQLVRMVFKAHTPYWEDVTETSLIFDPADTQPGAFLGNPFFPIRLAASEIAINTTVTNPGDVEVWPIIRINAPGNSIKIFNYTAGNVIDISSYSLSSGQIVIDTRPGYKTVIKDGIENLWSYVTSASGLWPLQPGANEIRLEMGDTANGYTLMEVAYTNQYLSP
jgi:hypothetical protein